MLVAMKKIDGELFDDLRYRFHQLDQTGDGKITKGDLVLLAKRKIKKVSLVSKKQEKKKLIET